MVFSVPTIEHGSAARARRDSSVRSVKAVSSAVHLLVPRSTSTQTLKQQSSILPSDEKPAGTAWLHVVGRCPGASGPSKPLNHLVMLLTGLVDSVRHSAIMVRLTALGHLQGLRAARLSLLGMLSLLRLLCSLPAHQACLRLRLALVVERCSQCSQPIHAQILLAEQGLQHLKLRSVVQRHAQLLQGLLRDLILLQGLLQGLMHGHWAGHEGLLGRLGHASWQPLRLPGEDVWLRRRQGPKQPIQVLPCLHSLQISPCKSNRAQSLQYHVPCREVKERNRRLLPPDTRLTQKRGFPYWRARERIV